MTSPSHKTVDGIISGVAKTYEPSIIAPESLSISKAKSALYHLLEAEAIDVYWEGGPLGVVPLWKIKELFGEEPE